ncbi:maleylpyruvate isomerase N-terminal domain-containing protein [Paeniglutamicibacter kerguelensis]
MAQAEREDIEDLLSTFTPEQWDEASLCGGWRVRDVVAPYGVLRRPRPHRSPAPVRQGPPDPGQSGRGRRDGAPDDRRTARRRPGPPAAVWTDGRIRWPGRARRRHDPPPGHPPSARAPAADSGGPAGTRAHGRDD